MVVCVIWRLLVFLVLFHHDEIYLHLNILGLLLTKEVRNQTCIMAGENLQEECKDPSLVSRIGIKGPFFPAKMNFCYLVFSQLPWQLAVCRFFFFAAGHVKCSKSCL